MDKNRLWMIGAVVAMVAVVALGLLLGIQPQLSSAAGADQQRQSIAVDNLSKQAALDKLKSDYKSLPALKQSLAELQKSVPSGQDLSSFLSSLNTLAGATQTVVASITVNDPQPYTPPAAPAVAASSDSGSASTDSSSSSTATPTPTPAPTAAKPQAPAQVTNSKITAQNFAAIPITLGVNGDYDQALAFVDGLQHGARLFLVTSFASAGSSSADGSQAGSPTSWTVGGYVYALVDPTSTATPTPAPAPSK